jgi:hypothetical protein
VEQQPHVVYPLTIEAVASDGDGGGHRRMQRTGDDLHVQIATHAPTPQEAQKAVDRIIAATGGVVVVGDGAGRGRRLLMPAAVVPIHSDAGAAPNQSESESQSARGGVAPREQELEALLAERNVELAERDTELAERDEELAGRDGQLAAALARVAELEARQC